MFNAKLSEYNYDSVRLSVLFCKEAATLISTLMSPTSASEAADLNLTPARGSALQEQGANGTFKAASTKAHSLCLERKFSIFQKLNKEDKERTEKLLCLQLNQKFNIAIGFNFI